jgi:hypothetical protein
MRMDAVRRFADDPLLGNRPIDQLVRTVTENSRTLKFDSHGFETE